MTLNEDKKYYSMRDLRFRWGVSLSKLNRMRAEGILVPDLVLGRTIRFSRELVERIESDKGKG